MHKYQVDLKWIGGRKGILSSPELSDTIEVATPPQFDKGIAGIWSPEHLFVASVAGCYMTTFLAIAENSRLEYHTFECSATGILSKVEGKFRITEVFLKPVLAIYNEEAREKSARILQKSEEACFIAHSIKAVVTLSAEIRIAHMSQS